MNIILLIAAVTTSLQAVRGQLSCYTPSGGKGQCVSLLDCPALVVVINKENRTEEDVQFLRKSKCGYEGQIPKVCCPENCMTPEGELGRCISIYSCPRLAEMTKNASEQNMQYLQNSKCAGTDKYSVCCEIEIGNCKNRINSFPPDPATRCCGISGAAGNKIIPGVEAAIDDYPWLAIIEHIKDGAIKTLCTGVLISAKYVLTAAHCVTGPVLDVGTPKNIRLGEYDVSNDGLDCVFDVGGGTDCSDPPVTIPIDVIIAHPQYDIANKKNDIALIRMRENAPYTDFIQPICLPTTDVTASLPDGDRHFRFTIAGWRTVNKTANIGNTVHQAFVPHVNNTECEQLHNQKGNISLWDKQLCAGGMNDECFCKGDTEGPLMSVNLRVHSYELIGIWNFGLGSCTVDKIPRVYTKIYEYNTWIRNTIKP
ncbi:phenoloxidase-activating enzyme-like [Achroia grisella]|uniref:phenoloxidase-activating enzyme-like n=1 Tax=Achroia grisella TaxID=688607 RepID=UPI0027D2B57E|nr:phenoloxidase-activating enzyme-like [Achroia grisella]